MESTSKVFKFTLKENHLVRVLQGVAVVEAGEKVKGTDVVQSCLIFHSITIRFVFGIKSKKVLTTYSFN